ncbi:DODA-type extradiol aromatic ring-opening family dioxygenase [Amphibiibacter pelophylacis]|uniref:Class III extradiol ring-cleavage dioxygenase n=1 Tax=Amphibiibacter pelophylacis TaxID=1799477 RepID=A0ACC6P307_9BURK
MSLQSTTATGTRWPTLFVSHGSPMFAVEPGTAGPLLNRLGQVLARDCGAPRAVLVVSPHWMTPGLRVGTSAQPQTIHDFGGFPAQLYTLQYPAPGAPDIAQAVIALLQAQGLAAQPDSQRGLDHGAWVPLMHLYPEADVPVLQVSLPQRMDAAQAWALGQALAPLRDQGVLVVGSGSLTHNLYEVFSGQAEDTAYAQGFVDWIRAALAEGDSTRLAAALELAPQAARAHPTSEHFLPLLVAAGAAAGDCVAALPGGMELGVLSMESYVFGLPATEAAFHHLRPQPEPA